MWNLHIIALLIMLSRGPKSPHDYVRPMVYNYRCSSIDQNGLHSIPCNECLQDGYQPHHHHYSDHHGHRGQRRQSSEDFFDYQRTRMLEEEEVLCNGCQLKYYGNILTNCSCHHDENMIEMKCLSTPNAIRYDIRCRR